MTTLDKLNFIIKSMKADGLTKADISYSIKLIAGRKFVIDGYYKRIRSYKR